MSKKAVLSVIVVFLAATMMACQFTGLVAPVTAPTPTISAPLPAAQPVNLADEQDKLVSIYQTVSPGVVIVKASATLGSGWVYSNDGYIVTNQHVVGTEKKVEVDFPTGVKVYGNVVGTDPNTDLAVIKVDLPADQLHPLAIGDSDTLRVGQIVVAIGDPLFLNASMTSGIISALGRSQASSVQAASGGFFTTGDIIQTDALLNHGNSGGPLLNLDGQVVGVNWAMAIDESSGLPSGIGYSISINTVKRVVPELIQKGRFDYPYLGITSQDDLPLDVITMLGLKSTTGVYISDVTPGGPADKAGLHGATQTTSNPQYKSGGDLVIAVDGQPVQVLDDLMRYVIVHKSPGDTITLTVLRGDQKLDLPLTLGVRP